MDRAEESPSLPHNLDAERSVLGSILLHEKAFLRVADVVVARDFYNPVHEAIFSAMVALDAARRPIDHLTISAAMHSAETFVKLRAFNGEAYFAELMSAVVTVEGIGFHARMVAELADRRRAIEAAQEVAALAMQGDEGWREAAGALAFAGLDRRNVSTQASARELLERVVTNIEARYDKKQAITGVPSGFHKLDAMTAGWQPSELIIIAARPSMGKTAFGGSLILHASGALAIPTLVFSAEMTGDSITERMISAEGRVDGLLLRTGVGLQPRDWVGITRAGGVIAEAKFVIDDQASPTLLDVRTRARRWRAETMTQHPAGLGLVVIDYLQLLQAIQAKTKNANREREVAELAAGLKALAKELHVPVIALCQLSRAAEQRGDKRPQLSDLRESGAIEQDADVVAFLYRDEVYDPDSEDKGIAEVIVGKQRNGPIGTVRLAFIGPYTRFENLSNRDAH